MAYISVIFIIPVIIYLCLYKFSVIDSSDQLNSGWLGFWGAYIGGIATMLAVYVTVKRNFDLTKFQKIQEVLLNNINVTHNLSFTNGTFNNEKTQLHHNYEPIHRKRKELIDTDTATQIFLDIYAKEKLPFGGLGPYLNNWQLLKNKIEYFRRFFQILPNVNCE